MEQLYHISYDIRRYTKQISDYKLLTLLLNFFRAALAGKKLQHSSTGKLPKAKYKRVNVQKSITHQSPLLRSECELSPLKIKLVAGC